jgi:hypothetical protein
MCYLPLDLLPLRLMNPLLINAHSARMASWRSRAVPARQLVRHVLKLIRLAGDDGQYCVWPGK